MAKKCGSPVRGLTDGEAAKKVASKLRGVASEMESHSLQNPRAAVVINAFKGVARALETAEVPPQRHESLALVQLMIAGLETMVPVAGVAPKAGANDIH